METPRSERGLDRLVNFSDATVAIAITLLGLPLIDVAKEIGDTGTVAFLGDNLGAFIAFGVSFVVIGQFWMRHHRFFDRVEGYTYRIAWINMLWLASIVLIPFVANALSASSSSRGSVDALYIGVLVVTSGSMGWMEIAYLRHPELLKDGESEHIDPLSAVVTTAVFAIAGVLACFFPSIGMFWLLLLLLTRPIVRLLGRSSAREPR